jgi:hypothetical protein
MYALILSCLSGVPFEFVMDPHRLLGLSATDQPPSIIVPLSVRSNPTVTV